MEAVLVKTMEMIFFSECDSIISFWVAAFFVFAAAGSVQSCEMNVKKVEHFWKYCVKGSKSGIRGWENVQWSWNI